MAFEQAAAVPTVRLGGAPLQPPLDDKLSRIAVEGQRNLPWMCVVEFWDEGGEVVDHPMLRPGQALEVTSDATADDPSQRSLGALFSGEIVGIEAAFTEEGASCVVRGYDKSHRLHRTRRTRTFLMQTDQAIAAEIAQECGLVAKADPTAPPHPYLCQRDQTDWEFLLERAREIGFEVGVSPTGQLVFREAGADPLAGPAQRLELGSGLLSLRTRVSSADQRATTKGHGWDPVQKAPVRGDAPPADPENEPGDPTLAPDAVAARFGSTEHVVADPRAGSQATAADRAEAVRQHAAGTAFEAEGTCQGNPALVPGGTVTVRDAAARYDGSYVLSSVRHVFDEEGYLTHFTINGRHDRSLLGLAHPGVAVRANGAGPYSALSSPVLAKVSNTNDPEQLGRVKVELPWLGDDVESDWAPVVAPGGGAGGGWQLLPEVNDQVLVVFEHGDPRRPYVLGGVYNRVDPPPEPAEAVAGGRTELRVFATRVGHRLTFDDTSGHEKIVLETAAGSTLVLQEGPSAQIRLVDAAGRNEISIDGQAGSVTVRSAGKLTVEAAQDLELTARGKVKIEGVAGVEVAGQGPVEVTSSASLGLESAGTAGVKANGPLTVQGTPIKLN